MLKVKETHLKNPPMDASSVKYTLIEIISKEKKESENLSFNYNIFNNKENDDNSSFSLLYWC